MDKELLLLINGSGSETQDQLWLLISYKWSWVFFYAILLYLIYRSFGPRNTLMIIIGVAVTITLSDMLSVHLFKEQFQRLRPCHDPSISHLLRSVQGKCGGQFGFISSHASNTMGLATLLITVGYRQWGFPILSMILWSAIVGYSRIYLGVHYPSDVMGGFIFGGVLGVIIGQALNRVINKSLR